MNIGIFVENDSLKSSDNSLHTQINNFLQHVKEKFSEVLLPVEDVTKLEMIGKGMHICMKPLAPGLNLITFTLLQIYHYVGAFGMVYKGKLVMPDSSVKAVAIKIIKCKCSNLLCYAIILCYIS